MIASHSKLLEDSVYLLNDLVCLLIKRESCGGVDAKVEFNFKKTLYLLILCYFFVEKQRLKQEEI